jgi:hypothetical protein
LVVPLLAFGMTSVPASLIDKRVATEAPVLSPYVFNIALADGYSPFAW